MRVLPDVVGIDKEFDYVVADGVEVHLGDVVRVQLGARRVGGWIVALDVEPVAGVRLQPVAKVSGRGPDGATIDLAAWASWRWAGRRAHFLRSASPSAVVRSLPAPAGATPVAERIDAPVTADALGRDRAVLRLGPAVDRYQLVRATIAAATAEGGNALVLVPGVAEAAVLGRRLRRDGLVVATLAGEGGVAGAGQWARARAGAVVVGARAAAWAPVARLARVLVLDEHDETYQEESSPTWHARDVAIERAARAGAPCLLVSPTPSLEALAWGDLVTDSRSRERNAWPRVEVIDQRDLDPTLGPLFSPSLVRLVRGPGRVLCVLNRTGRARLLACGSCATLARCDTCAAAVALERHDTGTEVLVCGRCGTERPVVCSACGGARFKQLRLGVSRAREELEALAGEPVGEVTASGTTGPVPDARVLIGTEALLHRVSRADAVAFLDFDQQLLALRYRAAEQALALLARAARVVRSAEGRGRVLVQTRAPEHPAVLAAQRGDPTLVVEAELPLRRALGLPPERVVAIVSGPSAAVFMQGFGEVDGVEVQGPVGGAWRIRTSDHDTLCDALAAAPRPPGRLRVEVDPLDT